MIKYSVIELKTSQLILGDALTLLEQLPTNFASLINADPPYHVSRKSNLHTMGRQGVDLGKWDRSFDDQLTWIKLAAPALKPGGSLVIWMDWKKMGDIAKYLEKLGFYVKRMLTWVKPNPPPWNCDKMFLQGTEHAIWAVKKWRRKTPEIFNTNYHTGVFNYAPQQSDHPTKKPDGLFEEIISLLSNSGGWVIDPFAGAGTTIKACKKLNRKCISFEMDPQYYRLAMNNWGASLD
jgi:site-specific DNA-methyltransferase (adenine-specific)